MARYREEFSPTAWGTGPDESRIGEGHRITGADRETSYIEPAHSQNFNNCLDSFSGNSVNFSSSIS